MWMKEQWAVGGREVAYGRIFSQQRRNKLHGAAIMDDILGIHENI